MDPHVGPLARLLLGAAFVAYFVATSLLYFWGPWRYPMEGGSGELIGFLGASTPLLPWATLQALAVGPASPGCRSASKRSCWWP